MGRKERKMRLIDTDVLMKVGLVLVVIGFLVCMLGLLIVVCACLLEDVV